MLRCGSSGGLDSMLVTRGHRSHDQEKVELRLRCGVDKSKFAKESDVSLCESSLKALFPRMPGAEIVDPERNKHCVRRELQQLHIAHPLKVALLSTVSNAVRVQCCNELQRECNE
jgi:hypothetical protein